MKYQKIYNRLRRIEGQIRGIEEMVAKEKSDVDILIQLEAARSSLSSTVSALIEEMIQKNSDGKTILDEVSFRAIMRSIKKT